MKIPRYLKIQLFSLIALIPSLSAQTATTDPVGYVNITITSGYNPIGISFCKPAVFTGKVVTSSSNSLTLSSAPDLGEGQFYVEVLTGGSGANIVGERIDVASTNGNLVTLNTTAPHNTLSDASIITPESTISIRTHFTVGDFDALISSHVNTDDTFDSATSDRILFYENGFKTHLNYEGEWYENFGSFEVITNKIIAPGSGFFYHRNPDAGTPSDFTVTIDGAVRTNNFVQKLLPGYQFISSGYPVDMSPAEFGYSSNLLASTNFNSLESDLILTWDNGFKTHLIYDDGTGTRNLYENFGSFNNVENTDLFSTLSAYILLIRSTSQVLEISRPF